MKAFKWWSSSCIHPSLSLIHPTGTSSRKWESKELDTHQAWKLQTLSSWKEWDLKKFFLPRVRIHPIFCSKHMNHKTEAHQRIWSLRVQMLKTYRPPTRVARISQCWIDALKAHQSSMTSSSCLKWLPMFFKTEWTRQRIVWVTLRMNLSIVTLKKYWQLVIQMTCEDCQMGAVVRW